MLLGNWVSVGEVLSRFRDDKGLQNWLNENFGDLNNRENIVLPRLMQWVYKIVLS